MTTRFRFKHPDLLRVRFGTSPLFEASNAARAFVHPDVRTYVGPWWEAVRGLGIEAELRPLLAVQPKGGHVPDFLSPSPSAPTPEYVDEIARARHTPVAQVVGDLRECLEGQRDPAAREVIRGLLVNPERARDKLLNAIELAWRELVEPWWPRLADLLATDIAYRSRALADHGLGEVFADLHAKVRWDGEAVEVGVRSEHDIQLDGAGLVLMPSAFIWPNVATTVNAPWQPTLIYPARGIATLWERTEAPRALARLIGRTRATLLADLGLPGSTSALASRHRLSASGVSAHLSALLDAGLLTKHRHGHEVRYQRTPLGDSLIEP